MPLAGHDDDTVSLLSKIRPFY